MENNQTETVRSESEELTVANVTTRKAPDYHYVRLKYHNPTNPFLIRHSSGHDITWVHSERNAQLIVQTLIQDQFNKGSHDRLTITKQLIPAEVGIQSLVSVVSSTFPVNFGNYFSFAGKGRCINMWEENLSYVKENFLDGDNRIEVDVYNIKQIDNSELEWCVVNDNRIPRKFLLEQPYYVGYWNMPPHLQNSIAHLYGWDQIASVNDDIIEKEKKWAKEVQNRPLGITQNTIEAVLDQVEKDKNHLLSNSEIDQWAENLSESIFIFHDSTNNEKK